MTVCIAILVVSSGVFLGPVNTCMVVATEAIFSQDKAARVPCSQAAQVNANAGLRENGPVPAGCA